MNTSSLLLNVLFHLSKCFYNHIYYQIIFPGKYCDQEGLEAVAGDCAAGFFCPAKSTSGTDAANICPLGAYCTEGVATPTYCSIGKIRKSRSY